MLSGYADSLSQGKDGVIALFAESGGQHGVTAYFIRPETSRRGNRRQEPRYARNRIIRLVILDTAVESCPIPPRDVVRLASSWSNLEPLPKSNRTPRCQAGPLTFK